MQSGSPEVPIVQSAGPNVGTAGGVILALVLIVAVLNRVYKFGR